MKMQCSQCGAELLVQKRDFFLKCPYCDARLLFNLPGRSLMISAPTIGEEAVQRLLPYGAVDSIRLVFFPYLETEGQGLEPFFSQPIPELDGYHPSSSSMSMLSSDDASPDQLMPPRDEQVSGTIIFHPFYQVSISSRGLPEVILVDAVSGLPLCPVAMPSVPLPRPSRSFIAVFIPLLICSALAFTLAHAAGLAAPDMLAASMAVSLVGGILLIRFRVLK